MMSNNTNTSVHNAVGQNCDYYGCYLESFRIFYANISVPVGLLVCLFGSVANTLNIIVLCQRKLRKSPTNILLTSLSLAQLLLLTGYIMLVLINHFQDTCVHFSWTFTGAVVKLVVVNINNVSHTTAFAITLYMAFLRVIAVRGSFSAHRIMSRRAVLKACLLMPIIVILLCCPAYLSSVPAKLTRFHPNCTDVWAGYHYNDDYYDLVYSNNTAIVKVSFLLFGVFLKLIPCAILIVLISLLISSLKKVECKRGKRTLLGYEHVYARRSTSFTLKMEYPPRRPKFGRSKTTKMLVMVLIFCVSIELPHGLLHLGSALKGDSFAENVYDNLGDFIEMLTLLYSSINFIIYCSMSSDFLCTFRMLFCRYKTKRLSSSMAESYTFHQIYSDLRRNKMRLKSETQTHDHGCKSDLM